MKEAKMKNKTIVQTVFDSVKELPGLTTVEHSSIITGIKRSSIESSLSKLKLSGYLKAEGSPSKFTVIKEFDHTPAQPRARNYEKKSFKQNRIPVVASSITIKKFVTIEVDGETHTMSEEVFNAIREIK